MVKILNKIKSIIINLFLMVVAFILTLIFALPIFIVNCIVRKDLAHYFFSIAIGLDQLGGSILYSQPDWTVSSWTYYLATYRKRKPAYYFMKFIDFLFGKKHCFRSFIRESKINNLPGD